VLEFAYGGELYHRLQQVHRMSENEAKFEREKAIAIDMFYPYEAIALTRHHRHILYLINHKRFLQCKLNRLALLI